MKKTTTIIVLVISILLVGLYTVTSTYSVIIEVIEKDGITEIVNKINIRDVLTNDNGSFNSTYYEIKNELNISDEEANILLDSTSLNDALQTVLESIVEYKVHNNIDAKLSDTALYNLISDAVINTNNISDELKSRLINKSKTYIKDVSEYIYDIDVSVLGDI